MRWFVTLLLAAGVAAGTVYLAAGDRIRTAITPAAPVPVGASVDLLDGLGGTIQSLTLAVPNEPALVLTRAADGTFTQPGNWPLRESEVAALINAVGGLRTRFAPIPVAEDGLNEYGLAPEQNPLKLTAEVKVADTVTRTVALTIGRPADPTGAFDRPCYARVGTEPEVVRLGADVYPVLARPPEVYRRRQLVTDVERVKLADAPAVPTALPGRTPIAGDAVTAVTLEQIAPSPSVVTLNRTGPTPPPRRDPDRPAAEPALTNARLASAWEVDGKAFRVRPDPVKLRAVLTAVPDLWAEAFVPADRASPVVTGLDKPERKVTVTRKDGRSLVVLIGGVARTAERPSDAPPPRGLPGQPPPPPAVTIEEYRYAKLADNDQVFELRADKLAELFADAGAYRDPVVARFQVGDVASVTVAPRGKPAVTLTKITGQKDADREEDRIDRWQVNGTPAEAAKVTELLDKLSGLRAPDAAAIQDGADAAKLKTLGLDPPAVTVTIRSDPPSAPGDPAVPPETVTLHLGTADAEKKTLAVRIADQSRVTRLDPSVLTLADRPALAYRGRRLFDAPGLALTAVTVTPAEGPAFALAATPKPAPASGTDWALTAPVTLPAAPAKADPLAESLTRAEAAEYIDDAPTPADLAGKYGLEKPRFTVKLDFKGLGAKVLRVGAARPGKPDVFARVDDGGVFALPQTVVDPLAAGPLGLLSPDVWAVGGRVTAVEINRAGDTYTLTKTPAGWGVRGPFDAPVPAATADPLVAALGTLKVLRFEALSTGDSAMYGFDAPRLTLTLTLAEGTPAGPVKLVVGNPADGGAFARAEGPGVTPAVFVVPNELVAVADKSALDRLDPTLLTLEPDRVTKLTVTAAESAESVTLVKAAGGEWAAEGAGFPIDGPTAATTAAAVARLTAGRIAAYGPAVKWADYGLEKPSATVTVGVAPRPPRATETHTVNLGKTAPDGGRFVRVDDGPAVGVLPAQAADVLARTRLDYVEKTLLAFDPAALTAVQRTRGKDVLEIVQSGTAWEVTKPAKLKADKPTVEELADALGRLRADRVAAFAPPDLDKFGLKSPAAVVTLSAGADKVLKIGGPVDPGKPAGDRFAAADVSGKPVVVGVLPAALCAKLLAEPLQFRDKTLAKFVDADQVTVARGDRTATFAKDGGTWKMTAPVAAAAEQADLDELVNALAGLRADEFAADKPADLAPFGLKSPVATLTLSAGGDPVLTLAVGTKEKAGPRVYAKAAKSDLVALLDPAVSARVLSEFRKRAVWTDADPAQVETVAVSAAGSHFVLLKDGPGWRDPAKPAEAVDAAAVTEFLAAFAGLKAERYVADTAPKLALYGLDQPTRIIVVTQAGGATKTLKLGGPEGTSGGKRVYAQVGDPARPEVFVVSEAAAAVLTRGRPGFGAKK